MKRKSAGLVFCVFGVLFFAGFGYGADDILPGRTEIVVRIDRDIPMGAARPGDIFPATIDQDIMSRGRLIVSRGARAEVRLVMVRPDTDEVAFSLYTITVNGRQYSISTDTARQYQERQTPTGGGQKPSLLGAAGGAVLGGAIGGTQGALTGAVIGAGGGYSWTGQSKMNARVSSGTRFLFTSREDVVLRR